MKLAQLIQAETEQLIEGWGEAALGIAPRLKSEDSRALGDHTRSLLELISEGFLSSPTCEESDRKTFGKDKVPASGIEGEHGKHRFRRGLSMPQMVQELQALRARVTKAWGDQQRGLGAKDIEELMRFIEATDQLIVNSTSSYSASKEQETHLIETMLKASPDPAAICDPDGKLLFLNKAMMDLVRAPSRNVIGRTLRELRLDFASEFHNEIAKIVTTGQPLRKEFHCCSPSGRELYFDCLFFPIFGDRNEVEAVVETLRDITEQKQTDYQVRRSANFDALTGLPNRVLFLDRLEQIVLDAQRKDSSFAVLFINLDRFKQTNDQLGHEGGDQLGAQVAERINTYVRAMDTVARFGEDEFALILKETGRNGAKEVAKALLSSLERAFDVESHRICISGRIGLTVFPDDGRDVDQLMHNADQAMYAAKEHGGQRIQVYEPWMVQSGSEQMQLSRELDDALGQNQLEVYYQPIIDIRTGAMAGAEALLRWNHPHKGLLAPDAFLSVMEQSGMADSLTAYVMEQALTCQFRWRDLNDQAFPIHINESPALFVTQSLVEQWRARLTQIGLDESWITMELTPASFNNIRASGFNPVKSLGSRLKLAIDDFGIEPFSLLALQEFKLDRVKLKRELIKGAGQGGEAERIVRGIIAMAHAIDVQVVGVGVETDEQLQCLSSAGCDYAQGFLFSEPLREDDFEALLSHYRQKTP